MPEWLKGPVLKTGRGEQLLVGSNPTPSAILLRARASRGFANPVNNGAQRLENNNLYVSVQPPSTVMMVPVM